MSRLTLLAKFSIISAALLAVIGVLLGLGLTKHSEDQAIEQEKENLASLVEPVLGSYITPDLMANGANDSEYRAIESAAGYLGTSGLVRLKIWSPKGKVVYSDDRNLVGKTFDVDGDLTEAFSGHTVGSISDLKAAENVDERGFGELLEVYTPLQEPNNGRILGAFEGYYDITDLRAHINDTTNFLWFSIGAGFFVLYISLFTLVRNASRTLSRQNEENRHLYQEATQRLTERDRAEADALRQVKRLQALRNIDIAITSSSTVTDSLSVILEQVCAQLEVDAADVLLLNGRTRILEFATGRGFRHTKIEASCLRLGEGYAGRAALEGQTLGVEHITDTGNLSRSNLLAGEDFVSYYAVPLIAKGYVQGVLEIFHRAELHPGPEWLSFLEALAGQTAIAVDNAGLFHNLEQSNKELERAYDKTLEGWSRALDLRDKETEGHSRRVTEMTLRLARRMGVSEEGLVHIHRGALLHDIGKVGIPDNILLKPGPLSPEEWEIMRMHPTYAYDLLNPIEFLGPSLDIPYCHHEKWDGTGYPRRLKGDEIPLAARIFAVADVWDALRSNRPYRAARPREMVYTYIKEQAGKHFDPAVVAAFLEMEGPTSAPAWMQTAPLAATQLSSNEQTTSTHVAVTVLQDTGSTGSKVNGVANGHTNGNGQAHKNGHSNGNGYSSNYITGSLTDKTLTGPLNGRTMLNTSPLTVHDLPANLPATEMEDEAALPVSSN